MDAVLQNFKRSFGLLTPFFYSLSIDLPTTMEELYRRAYRYSTLEDNIRAATQIVMIINQPAEKDKPTGKKPSASKEGQSRDKSGPKTSLIKRESPRNSPPLNISYERLLPLILDLPNFKWLAPIQTDPSQRNKSLWCDYHRNHGHETDRCQSLKFLVKNLIKVGHLKRYLGEVYQGVESGQPTGRITASLMAMLEPKPSINYIHGGPTND